MDLRDLDLNPHPERVSDAYADERIRQKISFYESERPQVGLRNVDEYLKSQGIAPAVRLHYITALAHLGRQAARTPESRAKLLERDLHPRGVPKE